MAIIKGQRRSSLEFTDQQVMAALKQMGAPIPNPSGNPNITDGPKLEIEGARVTVKWTEQEDISV